MRNILGYGFVALFGPKNVLLAVHLHLDYDRKLSTLFGPV